jgi:hypothetical protein
MLPLAWGLRTTPTGKFMMRFLFAACAVAMIAAAPALADTGSTGTAAVQVMPEKKICRTEEVTGSNISETHCHTKAEWASIDKQHQAEINSLRDSGHWSSNGH